MSHSQFHCTSRAYLDMHGLIFETSICYWQDQPGRCALSRRERAPPGKEARASRRAGHPAAAAATRTDVARGVRVARQRGAGGGKTRRHVSPAGPAPPAASGPPSARPRPRNAARDGVEGRGSNPGLAPRAARGAGERGTGRSRRGPRPASSPGPCPGSARPRRPRRPAGPRRPLGRARPLGAMQTGCRATLARTQRRRLAAGGGGHGGGAAAGPEGGDAHRGAGPRSRQTRAEKRERRRRRPGAPRRRRGWRHEAPREALRGARSRRRMRVGHREHTRGLTAGAPPGNEGGPAAPREPTGSGLPQQDSAPRGGARGPPPPPPPRTPPTSHPGRTSRPRAHPPPRHRARGAPRRGEPPPAPM